MPRLVLIHGRSQEHKDAGDLKAEWLEALNKGLAKHSLQLPITESDVKFPYYGQTLYDLTKGKSDDEVADIIVKGTGAGSAEDEFTKAVLNEVLADAVEKAKQSDSLTPEEIEYLGGPDVIDRGILNWDWVQKGLEALDRFVPGASSATIALFTRDVHTYMKNQGVASEIEAGIREAMDPNDKNVVVAHSLGTVVAYNLLRREAASMGWDVPLFVTVGSPLGVTAISGSLAPRKFPPVGAWYNALDSDDFVALYPLTQSTFRLPGPEMIENYDGVDNHTSNQHGIAGYLDDREVSRRIYDALV